MPARRRSRRRADASASRSRRPLGRRRHVQLHAEHAPAGLLASGNTLAGLHRTTPTSPSGASYAYQGNYNGFRIIDITEPDNPKVVTEYRDCQGNQGDVIIWDNLVTVVELAAAPAGRPATANRSGPGLGGAAHLRHQQPRRSDPVGKHPSTRVRLAHRHRRAGSRERAPAHLQHAVQRQLCPGIDIVKVPLANPPPHVTYAEPAGRSCHDTGVILGDAMLAGCAGGTASRSGASAAPRGGSLRTRALLYRSPFPGVTIGHSAGFTWDGQVLIFGHEPGGGGQPRCQATSTETGPESLFFYDARTGARSAMLLPRPQTATENCTWHNYNVVPHRQTLRPRVTATTSPGSASSTSPTRPTRWRSRTPIRRRSDDPARLAATGRPTGTTADLRVRHHAWAYHLEAERPRRRRRPRLGHLNPQTQEFKGSPGGGRPARSPSPPRGRSTRL